MSVTMLLRRSPELDPTALGHMHLISSTTLSHSVTPPDRARSPDHVRSNNSIDSLGQKGLITLRAVPKGRGAVVPHSVHLRDLHGLKLKAASQHGSTACTAGHAQAVVIGQAASVQLGKSELTAQSDTASGAEFDLCDQSQKLAMQLQAGLQSQLQLPVIAANKRGGLVSIAAHHADLAACMLASDIHMDRDAVSRNESPDSELHAAQGSYSMQLPALDSDTAGTAAAGADQSQGPCSVQPSAADAPLARKSSTVRFLLDSQKDDTDCAASCSGVIAVEETHSISQSPAVSEVPGLHGSRSVSSLSAAGSLKSALKSTLSGASSASAVSFAVDDGVSSQAQGVDQERGEAPLKQGSGSFPSWLTEE